MLTWWRWRLHLFLAGLGLVVIGLLLPAPDVRIAEPQSRLDRLAPVWQFNEVHSIAVAAPCAKTWAAIKEVTAGEIKLFHALTWIRRFGRPGPESILNAPPSTPILEVATRTGFELLAEEPGREIVIGMTLISPDRAKGFMNFRLTDLGPAGCDVTTETRVRAVDPSARRRFAVYWRVIYPGSALIRRMWLRAIRERAEAQ